MHSALIEFNLSMALFIKWLAAFRVFKELDQEAVLVSIGLSILGDDEANLADFIGQ